MQPSPEWFDVLPFFFFAEWYYYYSAPFLALSLYFGTLIFASSWRRGGGWISLLFLAPLGVYGFPIAWFCFWVATYIVLFVLSIPVSILGFGDSYVAFVLCTALSALATLFVLFIGWRR